MTRSRYSRQTALGVIGSAGQENLSRSTVVVVGCGALGSVQAELLSRAGVGRLILIDRDVLELHNLQRQILFDEQDVREAMPKAAAAARRLKAINSEIAIETRIVDLTASNVAELIGPADLVMDGTDNFETRFVLNDASVQAQRPWIYGGVLGAEGTVMAVRPGQGPCLRCLLPELPEAHLQPTCETFGVLNTAVLWVAALQVTEALKILVRESSAEFKLHSLDVWHGKVHSTTVAPRNSCVCCQDGRYEFLSGRRGSFSTTLCGRNAVQITRDTPVALDFRTLSQKLEHHGPVTINGLVLEWKCEGHRMVLFPDGRVLVMGTMDTAKARSLVAKYIGS